MSIIENPSTSMVAVLARSEASNGRASELALELQLPLIPAGSEPKHCAEAKYLILVDDLGLSLVQTGPKAPGAIKVDFTSGATSHRRVYGGGKGQLIAKSVGLHQGAKPSVLDATAGLGGDAFVLASLGCSVTLVEQSPVVAALLKDGLSRASEDSELTGILSRMAFSHADSLDYMRGVTDTTRPDIVYLDPMFPERAKAAKVKKEMSAFHDIVGISDDDSVLLDVALSVARCRVVVKRPKGAECISDREPSYQLKGKSSRYDIYTLRKLV